MKTHIQRFFLGTFTACLLFTGGCDATSTGDNTTDEYTAMSNTLITEIAVRSHFISNQCGIDKASTTVINNKTELETIITKSRRTVLSDKPAALPEIDFVGNMALLIALGTKSSAGYSIELTGDSARIRDNTLILPVGIISPDKGGFQAQVITSPCMIISFTKGNYTQVFVNKTLGNIRL